MVPGRHDLATDTTPLPALPEPMAPCRPLAYVLVAAVVGLVPMGVVAVRNLKRFGATRRLVNLTMLLLVAVLVATVALQWWDQPGRFPQWLQLNGLGGLGGAVPLYLLHRGPARDATGPTGEYTSVFEESLVILLAILGQVAFLLVLHVLF